MKYMPYGYGEALEFATRQARGLAIPYLIFRYPDLSHFCSPANVSRDIKHVVAIVLSDGRVFVPQE